MSNRALQQIDFKLEDQGEVHTFSLIPLKKKTAVNVFHNILLAVIDTISGAIKEDASDDEVLEAMLKGLKGLDFDQFWFIAERVFKFAVIDDIETKKLEDSEWWPSNMVLLYRATFEGIKRNYPEVFTRLGLSGLFKDKDPDKKEKTSGGTPDPKSDTP